MAVGRGRARGARARMAAVAVGLALAAGACGGRTVGSGASGGEAAATYPVLARVPAGASWAVVARRARDGKVALDRLLELAAMAELAATGADPDAGAMRALLAAVDLAAAGIDPDASAALFGQRGRPTLLVRIADAARLRGAVAAGADGSLRSATHGGREVATFEVGQLELAAAEIDGWWAVHALDPVSRADDGWIDELGAGGAGLAGEAVAAEMAARGAEGLALVRGSKAEPPPDLLGLVRTRALGRELSALEEAPAGLGACADRAAAGAPLLLLAAGASPTGVDLWAAADLAPVAARILREKVAPPPPPGYAEYRDGAALSVDWSVDLDLAERVRAAVDCPGLDRPIVDPVHEMTGFAGPLGWHLAATALDPDDLSGAAAVHLVLADPGLIEAQLESIPARSLFERTRRVAGVPVKVLSVPGLPSIGYRLDRDRFTLALGDGVLEVVLGPGQAPFPAGELGRFELRPLRLPNLADLLAAGAEAAAGRQAARSARALAERLVAYERLSLGAHLDGDSIAVFARMRQGSAARAGAPAPLRSARRTVW